MRSYSIASIRLHLPNLIVMSFIASHKICTHDEIFADIVEDSRLAHDQKLFQLLQAAYSPDSALYQDICLQIEQLGLSEFQLQDKENANGNGKVEKTEDTRPVGEVPDLTSNERRLSFELMHYLPNKSLLKPPETAVSTVNVVTKVTDLENNVYVPVKTEKAALADKLKRYRGRFQLSNQKSQRHPPETIRKEASVQDPATTLNGTMADQVRLPMARKLSVMGQNLPLYIKNQLGGSGGGNSSSKPAKSSDIATERPKDPIDPKISQKDHQNFPKHTHTDSVESSIQAGPRKNTRIDNLLANLESLYIHNGDQSEATSYGSNTNNGSAISDADREYILPSSFTKWNDDNGIHVYHSSLEEASSNEEEEEEEEDGEYLFQVL